MTNRPWIPPIRDLRAVSCNRQVVVAVEITPPSAMSIHQFGSALLRFYSWIRSARPRTTLTLESTCAAYALPISTFRFTSTQKGNGIAWWSTIGTNRRLLTERRPEHPPAMPLFYRVQGKSSSGNNRSRKAEQRDRDKRKLRRPDDREEADLDRQPGSPPQNVPSNPARMDSSAHRESPGSAGGSTASPADTIAHNHAAGALVRACRNCAVAKTKCVARGADSGGDCERYAPYSLLPFALSTCAPRGSGLGVGCR
ncbi:uncharacterized protein J3D65DRAFT_607391 [Phyllosticta citribraziliensis]|uniref:Uncharacterized protein n=1 Tax=Phyllosticta citribraziliensis TaxID=989973 RepID=A0ABR1L9H2_9PEZI